MAQFTKEQVNQKMSSITGLISDAVFSLENRERIIDICQKNHLSNERIAGVGRSFGYLLLGLIFPKDLPSQIVKEANIDPRIAAEIAQEIDHKIILPALAIELNKAYGFKLDVVDTPKVVLQTQPKEAPHATTTQVEYPSLDQNVTTAPIEPTPNPVPEAPLVIHEHTSQEPTPIHLDGEYAGGLVRPSFYSPETSGPSAGESTPVAHLEIGVDIPSEELQTTRVGKEEAQVVHYSAPEVALDPFSGAPKSTPYAETKKNIDPNNIVNLKDLPQ